MNDKDINLNEDWPVVTVKMTNGENLLARQVDYDSEKDVIYLMDVVKMIQTLSNNGNMTVPVNLPTLYSPFSVNRIIAIAGTDLLFAQDCSEYYEKYYKSVINELYEIENSKQQTVLKMMQENTIKDSFTEEESPDTIITEGTKILH